MHLIATLTLIAGDNGQGIVGETDDKIVTFFSLGLVVFFTVLVIVLSWVQGRLEHRKEERKAAELRRRVGW
jgi:preprotein translocase subunit SecG